MSANTTDECGNLVMPSDGTESADDPDIWKSRMREVQGAIILASLFQVRRAVGRCYFGATDWKVLSQAIANVSLSHEYFFYR